MFRRLLPEAFAPNRPWGMHGTSLALHPLVACVFLFALPCSFKSVMLMTSRQQSVLVGAAVTGILSTSYLGFINTLCCLGVVIGGAVATQQYASRTGGPVESGDGAVLGALAGAGGAVLAALFDVVLRPFNLDSQSIQQGLQEQLMQGMNGEQGMSPEMMQQMQGEGPGLLSVMGLAFLLLNVIVFAIFGAIGGAIGAAIFGDETNGGADGGQPVEAEGVQE